MNRDQMEEPHWLETKSDKVSQDVWKGAKALFLLSQKWICPSGGKKANKSNTHGVTNSRLWHSSDPKHVLIIILWLPVEIDVISTHIPTGVISVQTVAWNQSDSGLRGLEWSNKNYERVWFELWSFLQFS